MGFTLDEYNMLISTWDSLRKAPKVLGSQLKKLAVLLSFAEAVLVSDLSIETVRTLSTTHYIVACASNYSTLRAANIRVTTFVCWKEVLFFIMTIMSLLLESMVPVTLG